MDIATLQKDMVTAMKARDKVTKDAISSLISAVKKAAIDAGCRDNIPEDMVNKAIMKELKTVKEQVDSCPAERTELLEEYKARMAVIEKYAPKLLSEDEIKNILNDKFADIIASGNKGAVMKAVMPEFKGKADGKLVQKAVAELLK